MYKNPNPAVADLTRKKSQAYSSCKTDLGSAAKKSSTCNLNTLRIYTMHIYYIEHRTVKKIIPQRTLLTIHYTICHSRCSDRGALKSACSRCSYFRKLCVPAVAIVYMLCVECMTEWRAGLEVFEHCPNEPRLS
jgi:hypothetical protein